jgi:Tfp pilus assembly protein PilN
MFQINLVPEIKIEQEKLNRLNRYVTEIAIVVFMLLGVIIIMFLSVNFYQRQKVSSLNSKTEKIENELKAYNEIEETVNSLETGIKEIKELQLSEEKWSLFFQNLEKATPDDIRITSLSLSGDSATANLEGSSVESIDRFIKSFNAYRVEKSKTVNGEEVKYKEETALFNNLVVTGYSKNNEKYIFDAEFNFSKEQL